jgi:replicative DNA helicase
LEFPKEAKVIIAKNRNGATAALEMGYASAQTRFIDLGDGI